MSIFRDTVLKKYWGKTITTEEYLQSRISVLESVIEDWIKSGRIKSRSEEIIEETIQKLKNTDPVEMEILQKKVEIDPKLEFDSSHLCNSEEDKTTLVLYEYIQNSTSLKDFMFDNSISKEDKIKVMNQIILAYMMAYNRFHFVHHDLHPGNVLVRKSNEILSTTYTAKDGKKVTVRCKYIPVIIDLGMVSLEWNGLLLDTLNQELPDWVREPAKEAKQDLNLLFDFVLGNEVDAGLYPDFKVVSFGNEYNTLLKTLKDKDVDEWFMDVVSNIK